MNQTQVEQSELNEEPKTNPRIRVPLPLGSEDSGVVPRMTAGVSETQRALSRLRFAPAVVIGALLGSAPYLVQEHARARSIEAPVQEVETSRLAAAAQPAQPVAAALPAAQPALPAPPAPQPPPAVVEFDEQEAEAANNPPARPTRATLERVMMQRARTLLRNGDAFGAQIVLERLASRVPHGSFVQQRKLLEIKVLYVLGGKSAAQRAASEFAKTYPHSTGLTHLSGLLL